MHWARIRRIGHITIVLSACGAVLGGILGCALSALIGPSVGEFRVRPNVLAIGAAFGLAVGSVLAPLSAWLFMRRVPIWRAIAETAAGTVVGTAIGLVFQPHHDTAWLSPPLLGIAGFVFAAIRLSVQSRVSRRSEVHAQAG